MYGQLFFNPELERPWGIEYVATAEALGAPLTKEQTISCDAAVDQWARSVRGLTVPERTQVRRIARMLPLGATDMPFQLSMALAHLRLPALVRAEREGRISSLCGDHLAPGPWQTFIGEKIDEVRLLATQIPDAAMEQGVADLMALAHSLVSSHPAWQATNGWVVGPLHDAAERMGLKDDVLSGLLINALLTRPWPEWKGFVALLMQFATTGCGAALIDANRRLEGVHLIKTRSDLLVGVMEDCVRARQASDGPLAVDAIVADRLAQVVADDVARAQGVLSATVDATHAGCWFGEAVTARNLDAVARAERLQTVQSVQTGSDRLAALRQAAAARAGKAAPVKASPARGVVLPSEGVAVQPIDLDPVHTWSVRRLVQWIGGDVRAPKPKRLDRAVVLKRENEQRRLVRAQTKNAPAARDLTAEDIDLAVQGALGTTAVFLLGEIDDMVFRARSLAVDPAAIEAGEALAGPLKALGAGTINDDARARELLCEADEALARLRRAIKVSAGELQLRQRFARQLQAALLAEPLFEGKRHGGLIACPLRAQDWGWVSDAYHLRWLRTGTLLRIDGVTRQLRPDEALGLYVTGKSLSGHFFDVSVHLWQRKPGGLGPPATGTEAFSPINARDWIDTLVPCAVLHVPSAD